MKIIYDFKLKLNIFANEMNFDKEFRETFELKNDLKDNLSKKKRKRENIKRLHDFHFFHFP